MYRPKNKEERLELRKSFLDGYNVTEIKEADCVIATSEKNGCYYLLIFDGTAANPCMNYYYRSEQARQKAIDDHVACRIRRIKEKEERKQEKAAAGPYTIDTSKPYSRVGEKYSMEYYSDEPWPHTATIRIVKRTACFVTLVHCYGDREDTKTERVKVSHDRNGEYLSFGSFYFFRASKRDLNEEEKQEKQEAEKGKIEDERLKVQEQTEEGRKFILEMADKYPINSGDPVVTIKWSEHPAFYSWEDGQLRLSIAAAEIVLKTLDEQRYNTGKGGYDKTSFLIEYKDEEGNAQTYEGRYDLGDNDGGLIQHIRAFGEYQFNHPNPAYSAEDGQSIINLANFLEGFTADGRIISVSFAPQLEDVAKIYNKAKKDANNQAEKDFEELQNILAMLTDEQITAGVFFEPFSDEKRRDVGRFFLQELMRRDTAKAFQVFNVWKSGGTLEDLGLS